MKKRLLAAVLCLAMLISCVPSFAFQAQASELPVITCNGSAQSAVSFPRNERITLTAEGGSWYQWQIKVNDSLWVNISGETGNTLDVSYAMIANLCQGDTAYLRVVADGERISDPVAVTAREAKIEATEEPATYVVQAAPEAIIHEYSTPTQEAPQPDHSAAVTEAQAAVDAAYATWQEKEAAYDAQEAVYTPLAEDAAAKLAAYEATQAAADAAKQAWLNSGVEVEVAPAETSAEDFDEAGNPVVLVPAQTAVTYDPELEAAYNAAQAEADSALQTYQAAEAARAEAEAALNAIGAELIEADNALAAAQDAWEDACLAQEALQESTGSSNYGLPRNGESNATYNVVINYVSESGETVADSYTATLAAGSNFSATVTFPTVQGYLPYLGEDQQNSLDLNFAPIAQDYTYTVVYKPTNVDYTVIHYKQNLENDNYTKAEEETKQGLTNSTVPDVAKSYEGFYALLYEKPAIAADGSTFVEVYYDRYYYLMNFNLDGGYGVEPIYARYGAPIGDVGTPKKAGYTFQGWSLNGSGATDLPTEMPAENRTYTALWQADATAKVTVVFWGENADDEGYSYIKSAEVNVKPGTEFTYSESGSLICALEEHTHSIEECYDLTCTQEVHTHSNACNTCGQTEHTEHTTACYAGVGNRQDVYTDLPNNPVNGLIADHWWYGKLIYFSGSWYEYNGSVDAGKIAPTICHKHSAGCIGCGKTEHTHSVDNDCYTLTCTETEHKHTSNCYMNGAGLDSNLWKFVRSDTVTVAADGSSTVNVYYDRTEKTLTFKYNYNYSYGNYRSTETITAKWGADISEQFKKITANAKSSFWTEKSGGGGPYTNFIGIMPQANITYYNRGAAGETGSMTYWGQDLNGDYTVELFKVTGVGGYTVTVEDRYEFEGFTYHHGSEIGSSASGAEFYYTRNSYTLTFNDGYNDVESKSVLYQAPLSTYSSYIPPVPSAYEPGSVRFGGWYLNPECSGAEYKLDEHTMPADNVLLYAKWVPVIHTVKFYLDQDAYEAGTELSTHSAITVAHGSKADPTPADPENGSYTFVGWFYMENGVEKAFDFENMPVNKDLQVYGKWSSNVLKEYTIYYKYRDAEGNETEIAAPTTGSGLAGITKTFDAKGGTDLYADYQDGYFPMTKSHSMTLDINATEENDTNVFTFWYVQREAVPYTVKYLNKSTGEPVADEKTVSDNRKAVVTETFVTVPGMMPDAYQKRLVVSVDENGNPDTEHNVIIFYYTEDTTHAYYKITHYTENLGTDSDGKPTWTEYASSQAVGDIGQPYSADPMTIPGFTYSTDVTGDQYTGVLTANGLELKLYYTRNSYPYQVRYLEQGTGKQLAEPKDGNGKYGQVISESAIVIANYTAVDPTSQTLNIRIEESQTEAKLNIITFYYTENDATINYVVVGPDGCGTVTPTSETLKVLSGSAQGSTARATNNSYKFVGWYSDATCTTPVDTSWVDDNNKLTPTKEADAAWDDVTTYYAKFEWNVADLTITKTGAQDIDENQSFIFTVTGADDVTKGTSVTVVINGNGSVTIKDLLIGAYTVTENSDWSWRYTPTGGGTVNVVANGTKVTFDNTRSQQYWLSGDNYNENQFTINSGNAGN